MLHVTDIVDVVVLGGGRTALSIRSRAMLSAEMKSGFILVPVLPSQWFKTQNRRSSAVSSLPRQVGVIPLQPEDASMLNLSGFEAWLAQATGIGSK